MTVESKEQKVMVRARQNREGENGEGGTNHHCPQIFLTNPLAVLRWAPSFLIFFIISDP